MADTPKRLPSRAVVKRRVLELDTPTLKALEKLEAHPMLKHLRGAEIIRRAIRAAKPAELAKEGV